MKSDVVMLCVPPDLTDRIQAVSRAANVTMQAVILTILMKHYGMDIPIQRRGRPKKDET